MKPLPPQPNTFDYARSPLKSDWMDIFLCSQCRFFLGTTSGLMNLASIFGVPCALSNWITALSLPCFPADLFIQKLLFLEPENRYLRFDEFIRPPYAFASDTRLYELGLRPRDNSPEEISELAIEMYDRTAGRLDYSDEDKHLQSRARLVFDAELNTGSACRMGRDFLRRYESLFPLA